jgi:hypothetical protein
LWFLQRVELACPLRGRATQQAAPPPHAHPPSLPPYLPPVHGWGAAAPPWRWPIGSHPCASVVMSAPRTPRSKPCRRPLFQPTRGPALLLLLEAEPQPPPATFAFTIHPHTRWVGFLDCGSPAPWGPARRAPPLPARPRRPRAAGAFSGALRKLRRGLPPAPATGAAAGAQPRNECGRHTPDWGTHSSEGLQHKLNASPSIALSHSIHPLLWPPPHRPSAHNHVSPASAPAHVKPLMPMQACRSTPGADRRRQPGCVRGGRQALEHPVSTTDRYTALSWWSRGTAVDLAAASSLCAVGPQPAPTRQTRRLFLLHARMLSSRLPLEKCGTLPRFSCKHVAFRNGPGSGRGGGGAGGLGANSPY